MDDAEDNVVGTLFVQNGEADSYNPEDWIQDVDVGSTIPYFRISLAEDDGGIPGSLFACALWNGAAFVSFAHHVPSHEQNDLSFFTKAKTLFGFDSVHVDTLASPHIFNADRLVDQYLYVLTKPTDIIKSSRFEGDRHSEVKER
ncbi:hypothetical protein BBP00_00005700 [Phytophthora kernoviae]|uniref:Uncharacterized protein n=1 Tax=Phytophthora kernoviae TaxID=325452 RepID=A0A3F2RN42_9STRA|nr:hypothetical protein BBP00_00005700 [Phytophthora kernoviae]